MNANSQPSRKASRLLLLACSAIALTGCAATEKLATFGAGDGRLAVSLPAVCEPFLNPVPVPAVTPKTDAGVAYTKTADALDEANDRLIVGGFCVVDQRKDYAVQKEKPK